MGVIKLQRNVKKDVASILSEVECNPTIQGHICINDSGLFDTSVINGVYGFPGRGNTSLNNLKVTAWRAISSLNNIGPNDLIFLYRTSGDEPGAQEFHGVFRVSQKDDFPAIFIHCNDSTYLPKRKGKQHLPFRFMFKSLTTHPISLPNDLRNKTYKKNNNLDIIKAFSETDPSKPSLWGFRHPSVMNIGAARKKSIVAISNRQVIFLLRLLSQGIERKEYQSQKEISKRYNVADLPSDVKMLDDAFFHESFRFARTIEYEAQLYAYIIRALKHPQSAFHKIITEDFRKINPSIPLEKVMENVILEIVITPHIQEEVDILLCDSEEKNFLILEIKNDVLNQEDVEQAEKYIQLVKQRFPNSQLINANVIGLRKKGIKHSDNVKLCYYYFERNGKEVNIRLKPN